MAKLPSHVSKALTDATRALDKEVNKKRVREKKNEEALIKKVGRKLREIYHGSKTYSKSGKRIPQVKSKVKPTTRTKAVKKSLRSAGLTRKEIAKLEGKK